jgi:hypothetical protein
MNREYQYLLKIDQSLPGHIRKNLESMPNNKGYIWRGVHYYGHLPVPSHENPDIWFMYEKYKNDLYIHETFYGKYKKVFRKLKNGKKELVSETFF